MIEKRQPWMKFYPADWQADEGLRQCGLTARGLWIEMIAIMHKSARYGYLLIAGVAPSDQQLALAASADAKTVRAALAELESWRVFSRDENGVIYSRRMVADADKARRDRENGSGGGNPALKLVHPSGDNQGVNPQDNRKRAGGDNPHDNGVDKAQMLEARSQKERTPPSLRSGHPQATGRRLPDDWKPSEADVVFAAELRLDHQAVAAKFRDYWHAKAGRDAAKTDWSATWRNWCRKDSEAKPQARGSPQNARKTADDAYMARVLAGHDEPENPMLRLQ